jgi:uncharacterized membrane protein
VLRRINIALVTLLCAIFITWHYTRFSHTTALILSLGALLSWLPLLLGISRKRASALMLSLLLTTPYLAYGMMEALANPGARAFAAALLLVSFLLAISLVASLRVSRLKTAAPSGQKAP